MATSTTQAGGPAPPCYVFRLIKFDAYGNKVQKRKYGFTAKNNEVTQLDKSVYEGIITRAEQTFNLRSKSSYSLYLVLGGGPYVHELGEPDLRLEDYPELSSHSWTQMRSYEQFHEKRNLMHALTPDAKNRKVINLCLIESTLHDLSLRKQFLKDLAQAKLASKTAKLNVESRMRESSASTTSAAAPTATSPTTPATIQIENGVSEPTSTGNTSSPPTPPKPASPTTSVPEDENRGETNGGRSSSPPRRESPYSEVQDFITSFANLIAPPPPPAGNGTAAAANHLPNMNLSAAEFIKRAANFVAPPPPPPPPLSASAAANLAQDAARTAATDPWAAAMAVQSAVRGLPYEPFTRMKTRNPSLALRAPAATSTTTPQPQPQRPAAATSASPASTAPTAKPASPALSTRSASDDKYASLKAVFDKFVTDFNADLADAFGGAPPSSDGDTDTRASTPTGSPAATLREKDVLEAKGEKENAPKVPSKKAAAPVAHRATCDVCNKWIYGTRYKCFTCPDWDCCDSCLASIDQHHPGHALAAIHTPKDLIRRRPVSNEGHQATHFAIHCDSCNVPITGIRYKCAHPSCPDFDLCSNCEADPASYANNRKIGDHSYKDHLMVKIRQPVSRFGLNTMGSGRWNLDKAIRSIQSAFLGATSLDETEARQSAPAPGLVGELKHGPGKDESTWTVDVPMPFAMYNGGDKEVHLSFDVGTNENGETVILGLSDTKTSPQQPAETSKAKAQKETETHTLVPCAYVSPPAYRAPLGCQMPKLPEKATTVTEEISEELATKVDLDARWINDLTFADGTTVAPGTIFNKVWSVENNGRSAWPEGTRLVCVSGFGKDAVSQSWQQDVAYKVESVSANTKTRITAENIVAPEVAGKFMSYYRFITPDGLRFGDRLWIDIIVEENEGSKSATSSLNSSSIVTPTLKVKGSEDNASVQGHPESVVTALSSAVTSPCTTESELVDMESLSALSHASDEEDDCDFVLLSDEDDFAEVESVAASSSRK